MKTILSLTIAAILLPLVSFAQERAAGQPYDSQVNWSALAGKIDLISSQNKTLATALTALQTQLTNLTATVSALGTRMTAVENRLSTIDNQIAVMNSRVGAIDGKLNSIAACGAQEKVWNGSSCVKITIPVPDTSAPVNNLTNQLASIAACGAQQRVWNGTACTNVSVPTPLSRGCSAVIIGTPSVGYDGHPSACPAGSLMIVTNAEADNGSGRHDDVSFRGVKTTYSCLQVQCQ